MSSNGKQHTTRIRAGICDCTLLKNCSWDLELWYQDALQLFAAFLSSKECEWLRVCLWYAMAESVLQRVSTPDDAEISSCILKDLKEKLGESVIDVELISRQVARKSSLYQHVVAEYGFDGGFTNIGYHWDNWQKEYTQTELMELSTRALPFWVLHAPYAARFAECWVAYHQIAQCTHGTYPHDNFSLEDLLRTANYLAKRPRIPICNLLASQTISGSMHCYCPDREALFFSLMKSGVSYKRAGVIAERSSHQANYGPNALTALSSLPLERSAYRVLASGLYLPPRSRAARKTLQLFDVY